jgi:flavin-binding protein dodecin
MHDTETGLSPRTEAIAEGIGRWAARLIKLIGWACVVAVPVLVVIGAVAVARSL